MIEVREKDSCLVIHVLQAELDACIAFEIRRELNKLDVTNRVALIIDFSQVQLMDSSGLAGIISVIKLLGTRKKVLLCNVQERPLYFLNLTNMAKFLSIHNTEEDAFNSLERTYERRAIRA